MALNKEELIKFLAEQTGKEVDELELDDEDISRFYEDEEIEDEEIDDEEIDDEEDEEDDEEDEDIEDDDDDDESILEDQIDESKLSDDAKIIYRAFLEEKERNKKKDLMNMIEVSGLKDQHKAVLKRMAKNGTKKKDIASSINDLLEIENSTKRKRKTTVVVPKGKIKGKKKKSGPKLGSRDFGALLATDLYKNRI